MAIPKIIHAITWPKINFYFPYFSVDVANRSKVAALDPVHAGLNEVCRTTVPEATHPGCIGLFSFGRLVS